MLQPPPKLQQTQSAISGVLSRTMQLRTTDVTSIRLRSLEGENLVVA
jgi:hypothetical protein